jgi:hypothetical protein
MHSTIHNAQSFAALTTVLRNADGMAGALATKTR